MLKILLGGFITGLAIGCANYKAPDSHNVVFKTRIVDQTLKQFKLVMVPKRETQGLNTTQALKAQRQTYRARIDEARSLDRKTQKILINELSSALKKTQFCQQDYWIIETNVHITKPFLLGECNDTASQKDIQTFPNTIKQW